MESPVQLCLFEQPTLNITRPIKEAMNASAKQCGLSREQIADEMNALADRYGISLSAGNGRRLTIEILEKWLNPQDVTRHVPLKALPVFCAVTKDATPLDIMAQPLGFKIIDARRQRLLDWAEAYHEARDARTRMRKLEEGL